MKSPDWLSDADRASEWSALSVVVAGIGVSGFAAADALLGFGATVTIVDEREGEAENDRARVLEILGAMVRLGPGSAARLPGNAQLVVTSPGWRPTAPLQHHFELKGWAEVTIVIRFWIIAGMFVALGLGVFYAEWVVGA